MAADLSDPNTTSAKQIAASALREAGVVGIGQAPTGLEITEAITRLQIMMQEWERKRWLVYSLVTLSKVSTGALTYTVGPGGNFDTGALSSRPAKLESAFLRQIQNMTPPNQVDFNLEILQAKEDYNRIALKSLQSFPGVVFLDPTWPLATLYVWPVPQANIYSVFITILAQLPQNFFNSEQASLVIPWEYYSAMLYNLAIRLRARFQIGSFPGDELPNLAKASLKTLRNANTAIARLNLPDFNRSFMYNIFSDRWY